MNNNLKGFAFSAVFHGLVFCSFISMGSLYPAAKMAKVIDFSLVERVGASQKEPAKSTPSEESPPPQKPVVETRVARKVNKISVPIPEPLVKEQVMAEKKNEEIENEPQVETITAAAQNPVEEKLGQAEGVAAAEVAVKGLVKELYVKVNFHNIQNDIQNKISYPRLARKMGWEGKVVVSFMVGEDGRVQNVHIVKSSGFSALDKNATATIRKAAPFPCPPVRAELVVPVIYRLA